MTPPETRRLRIGCEFVYRAEIPTPTVFQVQPVPAPDVWVADEEWTFEPELDVRRYTDLYGNPCLRTVLPSGSSVLRYAAHATVPDAVDDGDPDAGEVPVADLPDDVLLFTLPSRYCLPDMLGNEAWKQFADVPPGYSRVQAICDHVHEHLTFQYGSSTATSTAARRLHQRVRGLPRLHAPGHLVLPGAEHPGPVRRSATCRTWTCRRTRAPMDFAAWMEVWIGDRWWTFDPRNNQRRKGRVVIGRGRDASDVAMATTFGGPMLESMTVVAEEDPGMSPLEQPPGRARPGDLPAGPDLRVPVRRADPAAAAPAARHAAAPARPTYARHVTAHDHRRPGASAALAGQRRQHRRPAGRGRRVEEYSSSRTPPP